MKVLILICAISSALSADWGYSGDIGPDHWKDDYEVCGKKSQSPINIDSDDVEYHEDLSTLTFSDGYDERLDMILTNNGHGVVISAAPGETATAQMTKGGLGATYKFAQFHFHWGTTDKAGSEHTLDDKMYPLEVHMVHYNTKYADSGVAFDKDDGLAVLGFFFEIGDEDNEAMTDIVNSLGKIKSVGATAALAGMKLNSMFGEDTDRFFRYDGALTIPPCWESVTWTVFQKPIKISAAQVAKFRGLMMEGDIPLTQNWRPTLPLNGRTVYYSIKPEASGSATISFNIILLVSAIIAKIML